MGAKLDVKKCFDSVYAQLADRVFELLGALAGMNRVLTSFHEDLNGWIEAEGCMADVAVILTMSIL